MTKIEDFCIINNSCRGYELYNLYNPSINPSFQNYSTPLVATLFTNDFCFLKFCENYDFYISIEPEFKAPKESEIYNCGELLKNKGYVGIGNLYPVMHLYNIEIHWIHEKIGNEKLIIKKWKERIKSSIDKPRIFLLDDLHLISTDSDISRKKIINRFTQLNGYSIFITKYSNESFSNDKHVVYYESEWSNKNINYLLYPCCCNIDWLSSQRRDTAKIYKSIIDNHIV
jgi:uncharacterized protein (DUF1919 family)